MIVIGCATRRDKEVRRENGVSNRGGGGGVLVSDYMVAMQAAQAAQTAQRTPCANSPMGVYEL